MRIRRRRTERISPLSVDHRSLYTNPIGEGADPHVVRDGDRYLWCQSEGNRGVAIWVSDRLTSLGRKHVVWRAPAAGPASREVWAPELHRIGDRWYVYVAASDGHNPTHRAYVLASESSDPLSAYTLQGPLGTGDDIDPGSALWAIDMTVLQLAGQSYAVWSGWPDYETDLQHLYIAPLADPTLIGGPRVRICANDDHDWEWTQPGRRGRPLHEAPQVLQRAGRTFLAYSCGASFLTTYKLGLLELVGSDPLDRQAWSKLPEPVFTGTDRVRGVGHGCFVEDADGWWLVFHAKMDNRRGWRRAVHVQPMSWDHAGLPLLGTPVDRGEPLAVPAGTPERRLDGARSWDFTAGWTALDDFAYYGHHQYVDVEPSGLHLGVQPAEPVNEYRSGEKVVALDGDWTDVRASTEFRLLDGDRAVGMLLRAVLPAVGYNRQRGYYAAVVPHRRRMVIGVMDGTGWHERSAVPMAVDRAAAGRLEVVARGDRISATASMGGEPATVTLQDVSYTSGSIGLRVVDTQAAFTSLSVTPLT